MAATIGQALLFHREAAARPASPAAQVRDAEAPDPRQHFDTPSSLVADPDLSRGEKAGLLKEWASDVDARLAAEAEGMGASDPLSARREGRLAEEAAKSADRADTDRARGSLAISLAERRNAPGQRRLQGSEASVFVLAAGVVTFTSYAPFSSTASDGSPT